LAAYSNGTSTGQFLGNPGGRSRITVRPSALQSSGELLSPSRICKAMERWFSERVANRSVRFVGSGVLRGMSTTFRFNNVCWSMPSTPRLWALTLPISSGARRPSADCLAFSQAA